MPAPIRSCAPRSDPHPFQASTQFCHPFLSSKPSIRCMQAKVWTMTGSLSRVSTAFAEVVPAPCRCSLAAPPSRSRCWDGQARRRTCKPPCRRSSKRCPPVSPRHRRVVRKASPLSPKAAGWAGRLAAGQGSWGVVWRWSWQPASRSLRQACYGRCWQGRSSGRSPGCLDPAGYLDRLSALALTHWETWQTPAKESTGLRPPQPARPCSSLLPSERFPSSRSGRC